MFSRFARRALCGAALCALALPCSALASASQGSVAGTVTSLDGRPVAGARIVLDGPAHAVATSASDGRFSLEGLAPGTYSARAGAARYTDPAPATIDVRAGTTTSLTFALARSESSLTTIGRTSTSGHATVSTSATPVTTIDAQAYADRGFTRVSDVLQDDETATLFHTAGGGSTVLPTSVAIRGPDPTETLVDIDGHQINNGNTGDFDLSLLDPADYTSIELVRGISPSSLVGPDTIDGAVNIRTIEPTTDPHGLLRLNFGSFGAFGGTLQSTGTVDGRLGYAISLHRQGSDGEIDQNVLDLNSGSVAHVGSEMLGSSAIAKLRYAFGAAGAGYAELSFHGQSAFRDLSAGLTTYPAPAGDTGDDFLRRGSSAAVDAGPVPALGAEGTALQTHNAGYGLDVSVPLGSPGSSGIAATTLLFRHYSSLVDESVYGPGAAQSPYLYNSRDLLDDETLQLDHRVGAGTLTLQYEVRNEALTTDFTPGVVNEQSVGRRIPPWTIPSAALDSAFTLPSDAGAAGSGSGTSTLALGQTQRSLALRYTYNPTPALHFVAGAYYSRLNLFGNYLDPRLGFVFTPDSRTAVRASVGTTYQSPQLPELVVPPASSLPATVGNYISIGNPNLKPDQATEYGLGFDRILFAGANPTAVSADFYRVNLRQPATTLVPNLDADCGPAPAGDGTPCPFSYPVNAGDGVYQGLELSARRNFGRWTTLRAGWAVRSAYLTAIGNNTQDGTLVLGEQSLGLPLHKISLTLNGSPPLGFTYGADLVYESLYNELNQPPFATLAAHLGYRFRGYEIGLSGTNLTDVYDQRFTRPSGGYPYGGQYGIPLAQDAYALQGTAFNFTVLRRF
jgi:outer membrane receptor protein involved in Fe transport